MFCLVRSRASYLLSGFFIMLSFNMLIYKDFMLFLIAIILSAIFLYVGILEDKEDLKYKKNFNVLQTGLRYIKGIS